MIGHKKARLRYISCILILALCLSLVGCTSKVQEKTTEAEVIDEDTLTDADGFRNVRDYVVTTQDGVKVRMEAKEDAEVYITLDKGVDLSRTVIKDEWTRLEINGANFYIQSKYVEETTVNWATETDDNQVSHIVYIDPAKQITEDTGLEPMSPEVDGPAITDTGEYATATSAQMAVMKEKMTTGAMGVSTGAFEYDITMNVANYLNAELVKRGYTVYLSRTTNNVNISNAKRAQMANACDAEVYIKIEATSSRDATASGVLGFIATSTNPHSGTLYQKNYELCYDVIKKACENTGATRMGIYETDGLTSLNYCNMPATVINMGFLSNENDDQDLASDEYRKKMAIGIAEGVDLYFESIEQQ